MTKISLDRKPGSNGPVRIIVKEVCGTKKKPLITTHDLPLNGTLEFSGDVTIRVIV